MSATLDDAILEREQSAITRARRLRDAADRAQEIGVSRSRQACSTSCRSFPNVAEFHATTERWVRASARRLSLARSLRQQAMHLLMFGGAR